MLVTETLDKSAVHFGLWCTTFKRNILNGIKARRKYCKWSTLKTTPHSPFRANNFSKLIPSKYLAKLCCTWPVVVGAIIWMVARPLHEIHLSIWYIHHRQWIKVVRFCSRSENSNPSWNIGLPIGTCFSAVWVWWSSVFLLHGLESLFPEFPFSIGIEIIFTSLRIILKEEKKLNKTCLKQTCYKVPSVPDHRSCIGSLKAMKYVHDLLQTMSWRNQSINVLRRVQ